MTIAATLCLSSFGLALALPTPQASVSGNNKYYTHHYNRLTQQASFINPGQSGPSGLLGAYGLSKKSSSAPPSAVPEPASGILLGLGMAAAALARRRKNLSSQ
ncbi:MAG: PEP-CTERM sorting domain-containing protein [Candidatus Zixiibacteriota bacterium]